MIRCVAFDVFDFSTTESDAFNFGFTKIGHFRFRVGTGNRKADVAEAETELYTSSKFHANELTGLGGVV